MRQEEFIYRLFGHAQDTKIDLYLPEIERKITTQTDKVTIDVREIDFQDLGKRKQDPTYLDDEMLKFTDTGISILYATDKIVELLKDKLPRTVKELTIPSEFLKDITFLQQFPNLETLNIADYAALSPEEIDYIANNTSIKNLTLRSSLTLDKLKCQPGYSIIKAGNMVGQYGKLMMFYRSYKGKWNPDVKLYTSDYSKKNLDALSALYNRIIPHIEELSTISITTDANPSQYADFDISISDKKVSKLVIRNVPPSDAARVYKEIVERTEVVETVLNLENQTYDDIYQLKQMAQTSNFTIKYSDSDYSRESTYAEYLNMRSAIDYYKELIEASNLSPVERIAYVYDILKTMRYQENNQDKLRSRNIHAIVTDGTIVCVGYATFARQLLSEFGIKCVNVSVTCKNEKGEDEYHARNILRVDDDKYGIHGLFAMDITWDSDKDIAAIDDEGKKTIVSKPPEEMQDKVTDKYDSLVLYRHFLIPMTDYEQRYPNETNPILYEAYKDGKAKIMVEEAKKIASGEMYPHKASKPSVLKQHQALFDIEEGHLTVERYFSAPKPSLETFEQILSSVRRAQGYTQEETKQEVDRVVELHQMLREQNPDEPDLFFQSAKPK